MAANNLSKAAAPSTTDTPDSETVVKQAALSSERLAKHIRVPAQLAGAYMSATFDDEGNSTGPVDPSVIDALKNQFPGIQIEELPS